MGCIGTTALTGVTFNCTDAPTGGLKRLLISHLADVVLTMDAGATQVTSVAYSGSLTAGVVELEFNNKDTFTSFTDVKTVDPAGSVSVVPTIVVEFPKMTKAKRDALDAMTSNAGFELVAFIETAGGTYHCVGSDFGLYASTVNGQSGTGRADKNMYQLTLTGEESH